MPKRRRKSLGNQDRGNYRAVARRFYASAQNNFENIRERHSRADTCGLIEHYTDVVAEATAAEVIAHEAGDTYTVERAKKLTSTATRAQRGAVAACRLGVRTRR